LAAIEFLLHAWTSSLVEVRG